MSMISSAHEPAPGIAVPSWASRVRTALARWWIAYVSWRIEQGAITQLSQMSDHDLKDIGVNRSDILHAVRFGPTDRLSRYS